MSGEIYQLVAIDKKGKQQVIKLNEDNSKYFLSFIDSITTSKESENLLIENLIAEGKLKNNDVTLVIKYNYGIVKYLPVIYNDSRLNRVSSNASNKEKLKSYAYFLFDEIVPAIFNNGFYDYMVCLNDGVLSEVNNGSYLNSYTVNQIRKFYETFKMGEDASYKEEYKRNLIKKISNYKTIRTLYIFFMHYINSIKNNMSQKKI